MWQWFLLFLNQGGSTPNKQHMCLISFWMSLSLSYIMSESFQQEQIWLYSKCENWVSTKICHFTPDFRESTHLDMFSDLTVDSFYQLMLWITHNSKWKKNKGWSNPEYFIYQVTSEKEFYKVSRSDSPGRDTAHRCPQSQRGWGMCFGPDEDCGTDPGKRWHKTHHKPAHTRTKK